MPRIVPSQVKAYIEKAFQGISSLTGARPYTLHFDVIVAARLHGLVELARQIPSELIQLSADDYSSYISNLGAIEISLNRWRMAGTVTLDSIEERGSGPTPVQVLHRLLSQCPDEFPSADTDELAWVDDLELRQSLRLDLSSTNNALAEGQWKAATVLAGSFIESLLLWAIKKLDDTAVEGAITKGVQAHILSQKPPSDKNEWTLHHFIAVSEVLGIILPETAIEARHAKHYRNLIHPGRETRLAQSCDRGTALSAIAAVEHVMRDLPTRLPKG